MKDRGSVPFEAALGVELTTYVIIDFAFFGKIRLDVVDNIRTNTPYYCSETHVRF
jgi:hypothetical protein